MDKKAFDLIIPTYRPDGDLKELLARAARQTMIPESVIIMNTDEGAWNEAGAQSIVESCAFADRIRVYHVDKQEFRHGRTRNIAASYCTSPLMVFMTQDAIPADTHLFERLLEPIISDMCSGQDEEQGKARVLMTYARQMAGKHAGEIEKITREFNYPAVSCTKTAADKQRLGIKIYFASDVCAGYERAAFEKLGGFTEDVMFNEDMLYAAKVVNAGGAVRYCADARVYHSHEYGPIKQLKRNFDNGASQAMHPEVYAGIGNESEGIRLVTTTARELISRGKPWLIPYMVIQSGCKYIGFRLGKIYAYLPRSVVTRLSANKEYWMR